MQETTIQALGGKARAQNLSEHERQQIAKKASKARWNLLSTKFDGELALGGIQINCSVLEKDGEVIRIINSGGFMKALGRPWKGSYKRTSRPNFLEAENLQPFITKEIESVLQIYEFRTSNGTLRRGYRAEIVPMVCEVYLAARQAGVITSPGQRKVAQACEIIMRGLARVGIAALVDEATGYQYSRERAALAKILEKFIAKELRAWTKTFPIEFYEQIFRLRGWKFDPATMRGPRVLGRYTDNIVYQRLAPGVLEALRAKNPVVDGRRKNKHFQWLTGDVGDPKLKSHIDGVLALMRISEAWDEFKKYLRKAYPIYEKTELGFHITLKED